MGGASKAVVPQRKREHSGLLLFARCLQVAAFFGYAVGLANWSSAVGTNVWLTDDTARIPRHPMNTFGIMDAECKCASLPGAAMGDVFPCPRAAQITRGIHIPVNRVSYFCAYAAIAAFAESTVLRSVHGGFHGLAQGVLRLVQVGFVVAAAYYNMELLKDIRRWLERACDPPDLNFVDLGVTPGLANFIRLIEVCLSVIAAFFAVANIGRPAAAVIVMTFAAIQIAYGCWSSELLLFFEHPTGSIPGIGWFGRSIGLFLGCDCESWPCAGELLELSIMRATLVGGSVFGMFAMIAAGFEGRLMSERGVVGRLCVLLGTVAVLCMTATLVVFILWYDGPHCAAAGQFMDTAKLGWGFTSALRGAWTFAASVATMTAGLVLARQARGIDCPIAAL
jgi:hypothetical protein